MTPCSGYPIPFFTVIFLIFPPFWPLTLPTPLKKWKWGTDDVHTCICHYTPLAAHYLDNINKIQTPEAIFHCHQKTTQIFRCFLYYRFNLHTYLLFNLIQLANVFTAYAKVRTGFLVTQLPSVSVPSGLERTFLPCTDSQRIAT